MTQPHEASLTGDETIETSFGTIRLEQNYPTDESSALLLNELDAQRAAQAYVWFTPLMGSATWRDQAAATFGATSLSDFVVYQTLREKRGILTANLTTPYIGNFMSLAEGPVLFDYPAGPTAGGVLDFWQRPATDLGQTGPDGGNGGGYVVIGPDADASPYDDSGRIVVRSATVNCWILFRVLDQDPKVMESVKDGFRIWREGQEAASANFIENVDREWSATPARGLRYWEDLANVLGQEPVREIDKGIMAMIAPLGIAPGQPFAPDDRQRLILENGAAIGELMARANQVSPRHDAPYWPGTNWFKSFDFSLEQETDTSVQLDERATWFYEAVGSSKGMVEPTVNKGQVYMTTKRDADGNLIRADRTYRLHVPAGMPVKQFWSLTLYSEATRRAYDNGGTAIRDISLDSRDEELVFNTDDSIDLYIGPTAPEGAETNWMKTTGDDGWFVYFRLYGPTQEYFDKTWALPDFTTT
ncbi:DUF1214 domain-containing protein [Streptomyces sp. NPDC048290]|uniref:DUF1214 domain-containing protein n=1 Tax=Streptomyces sp. NPDC048290 TaxID=3155811 RepID=UPI00344A9C14